MGFLDADLVAAREAYVAPKTATTSLSGAKKSVSAISKATGTQTGSASATTAPASTVYTGAKTQVTTAPQVIGDPNWKSNPQIAAEAGGDPVVSEEITTQSAVDDYQNTMLAQYTEDDINAALRAIEAEFGLTREQLLGDQTMIGAQYRLLTAQLARQQARALEGAESSALQRGLFRSGIFASEVGDIGQEFGEKQSQNALAKQAQDLAIEQRLATLSAEEESAKAAEETAIRRGEYTARLAAAGL